MIISSHTKLYSMETIQTPSHYAQGSKQPIDFMRECMTEEAFEGFMVGNAVKYLMRYNYKDGIKDLYKCLDYVQRLIKFKEEIDNKGVTIGFGNSNDTHIVEETPKTQTKSTKKVVRQEETSAGADLF